ncbi:MAG: hypothetical protein ABIR06_13645 [Cyclobacteriaceae bacterium]
MQKLALIGFLVLAFACNKEDDPEVFTSLSGYWIVRTPDNATTVTFKIVTDANSQYVIENISVTHNGGAYGGQPIDSRIMVTSPTEVESIYFRTSDFVIGLLGMSVNTTFTELQISNSSWNIDGAFREFAMIAATRK